MSTVPRARMVSVPLAYTTEAIEQNTPTGVNSMTTETIFTEISLTEYASVTKGSAFFPSARQVMPTMTANTSTCSISPLAKEATGLAGIRFFTVSSRLVNCVAVTSDSTISMVTPLPRPSIFGRNSPSKLANRVVAV